MIFVPYTLIHPMTLVCLLPFEWTAVRMMADQDYWLYFRERWREGKTFVNIEHDVVFPPYVIDALLACPEPWCAHTISEVDDPTRFSLVKFGEGLIDRTQDCWEGFKEDERHWSRLDGPFAARMAKKHIKPHRHNPPIRDYSGWWKTEQSRKMRVEQGTDFFGTLRRHIHDSIS